MTIKIIYFARTIYFIAFALSLLTGCGGAVKVIEPVKYEGQTVPFFSRDMDYVDLVWSDSEIMALVNTPPSLFAYKLYAYDFLLDTVRKIEIPVLEGCSTTRVVALRRLPNGQIGLMLSCRNDKLLLVGYRLVEWDRKNSEFVMLEQLDDASFLKDRDYFHPRGFVYSPDFRMLFLERNADGVNNRLVMLDTQTKYIEDFVPQFARSGSPAWSDDGTLLAFAANGDANNNPLHRANDINGAWNIYIMEPHKVEPQLVLNNIPHAAYMKWRPNSNTQLTFRGMYKRKTGLWLYDIGSKKMRFIWPEIRYGKKIFYDWSPDGKSIVLIDCQGSTLDSNECIPKIVDVD